MADIIGGPIVLEYKDLSDSGLGSFKELLAPLGYSIIDVEEVLFGEAVSDQ